MILFPLAAIWLVLVVVWAIRKGVFKPPEPEEREPVRRTPRDPRPELSGRGGPAGRSGGRTRRGPAVASRRGVRTP